MVEKLKKRSRKQILFIVIVGAIILVLLAMAAGFIFSSKYAGRISRIFLDLNPFKPEQKSDGDKGGLGTPSPLNRTSSAGGTASTSGTSAEAEEEVTYGSGKLRIVNYIGNTDFGMGSHNILHYSGATEGFDSGLDHPYSGFFSPSGKVTKVVSIITNYNLSVDSRPTTSLSTISLELSLHSQSGGAITLNSTNELRLSLPLADRGYTFANKTITIQQYDPSNPSASYTSYNIRDVIDDDGGVIVLARLDGSYESEVPYAYFRVGFS